MVDNKNDSGNKSYAAVVGENDNQPEGTVVGTESQPPPYTPNAPGPSTQPPSNAKAHPPVKGGPRHPQLYNVSFTGQGRAPQQHQHAPSAGHAEAGAIVLIGHSPEYYQAVSRARRRFWGTLFWALLIYLVAAAVIGGGVEDAYRNSHRRHRHKDHDIVINAGEVASE